MDPVVLPANLPDTFYRGAGRIAAFRGSRFGPVDPGRPEDWIASTVSRFGTAEAGLTRLPGGSLLRDVIEADPRAWLGPTAPAEAPSLAVPLVKYLDAGQRLPVHLHPDDRFARAHLGAYHGKTEAWLVMDAVPGSCVYLGWRRDMTPDELRVLVERQDVPTMLAAMIPVEVHGGDTVVVPAGTVHAIDDGIFVTEVQQAADLSILLEWKGFLPDDEQAFAGLDIGAALGCVDLAAMDTVEELIIRNALDREPHSVSVDLLAPPAEEYFRATLLRGGASLPAGYSTLVVLAGSGMLRPADGVDTPVEQGMTLAVPFAAGSLEVIGEVRIASFGPRPHSGEFQNDHVK